MMIVVSMTENIKCVDRGGDEVYYRASYTPIGYVVEIGQFDGEGRLVWKAKEGEVYRTKTRALGIAHARAWYLAGLTVEPE